MTAAASPGPTSIVPAADAGPVAAEVVQHPDPGLADAAALAAAYADDLLVGTARHTHLAVSKRVFGLLGRVSHDAKRIQRLHDGIAGGIYGSLSLTLRTTGLGLTRLGRAEVGPRLNDSAVGRAVQSAVNGLIGERLSTDHPHLALQLSIRVDGRPVLPRRDDLAAAFPGATGRVVVFLHGLGEQEGNWGFRAQEEMGGTYGSRLRTVGGWTPVYLRANTGLGVNVNGVALTSLLQEMVDHWPVPVQRIALVGHSMGGLIMRSACAVTTPASQPWLDRLSDLVTLGTPHLGADLALGTKHGSQLLRLVEETSGFHRILEHRSPGIRDLERGLPDLPPLPHVRYRLVSAEVGSPRVPLGRIFGDLLVRRRSAHGIKRMGVRRTMRLFPDADVLHVPRANHFSLLNHPDVDRAMRGWLA